MPVQGVIKSVLKGRLFNSIETRNVFYYGSQINNFADYVTSDFGAVHQGMDDIASNLTPVTCSTMLYYAFDSYYWDNEHWILKEEVPIIDGEGLQPTDPLPPQVAMLLKFSTTAFRMIGHKYFAGLVEPHQNSGQILGEALVMLIDVGAAIMDSRAVGGRVWYPGIPGKSSAFAPFTSCIIHDMLSTMRRRKAGVGI